MADAAELARGGLRLMDGPQAPAPTRTLPPPMAPLRGVPTPAPAAPDQSPPTWDEVMAHPEMKKLSGDQLEAARQQYFEDVVAPHVPTEQVDAAWQAFDADTNPGIASRLKRGVSRLLKPSEPSPLAPVPKPVATPPVTPPATSPPFPASPDQPFQGVKQLQSGKASMFTPEQQAQMNAEDASPKELAALDQAIAKAPTQHERDALVAERTRLSKSPLSGTPVQSEVTAPTVEVTAKRDGVLSGMTQEVYHSDDEPPQDAEKLITEFATHNNVSRDIAASEIAGIQLAAKKRLDQGEAPAAVQKWAAERYATPMGSIRESTGRSFNDYLLGLASGTATLLATPAGLANALTGGAYDAAVKAISGKSVTQMATDIDAYLTGKMSDQTLSEKYNLATTQGGVNVVTRLLQNPKLLAQVGAESAPSTLGLIGITRGAIVKAYQSAYEGAVAAGRSQATAASLGREAAVNAGEKANVVANGLMGAGQNALQTKQQVMAMPQSDLEQSPVYTWLRKYVDPDTAREVTANLAAEPSAVIAGLGDAVATKYSGAGKSEAELLGGKSIADKIRAFRAAPAPEAIGSIMRPFFNEMKEEFAQSGPSEQGGQNVGIKLAANPKQSLTDQVMEQGAIGATLAAGQTGAMHAAGALVKPLGKAEQPAERARVEPTMGAEPEVKGPEANVASMPANPQGPKEPAFDVNAPVITPEAAAADKGQLFHEEPTLKTLPDVEHKEPAPAKPSVAAQATEDKNAPIPAADLLGQPEIVSSETLKTEENVKQQVAPPAVKTGEPLATPEYRTELEAVAKNAGWSEVGGKMIRDTEGNVTGRTSWIPKEDWWPNRPDKLNPEQVQEAVRKALAGEPLKAAEKRTVDYMLESAQQRLKTASVLTQVDLPVTDQNIVDHALVKRAADVDEDAVERLSLQYPNDDAAFMSGIREIIHGNESAKTGAVGEARAAAGTGQSAQAETPAVQNAQDRQEVKVYNSRLPAMGQAAQLKRRTGIAYEAVPHPTEAGKWMVRPSGETNAQAVRSDTRQVGEGSAGGQSGVQPGAVGSGSDLQLQKSGQPGNGQEQRSGNGQAGNPPPLKKERRSNLEKRKAVAEMSKAELRSALLSSDLTGLGNRRAYDEAPKRPVQASIDLDSLKAINDVMGHQSGDILLAKVGEALRNAGLEAYHVSGDEFLAQFDTEDAGHKALRAVRDVLQSAIIHVELPDGSTVTNTGVTFSYGLGKTLETADHNLKVDKAHREQQGLRSARGREPPGMARTPAGGKQNQERGSAQGITNAEIQSAGASVSNRAPGLVGNEKTVHKSESIGVQKLRRSGNKSVSRVVGELQHVPAGHGTETRPANDAGPEGQQRQLQSSQLQVGNAAGAKRESAQHAQSDGGRGANDSAAGKSAARDLAGDDASKNTLRSELGADFNAGEVTKSQAASAGKEVERFTGVYKRGLTEFNAKRVAKERATQNPNLDWRIEPAAEFGPDRFVVVGHEHAVDTAAHEAAASPKNDLPEPTKAQIEANNAKLGHPRINGLDISIENPAGSVREDKHNVPPQWRQEMASHYGYIARVDSQTAPRGKDKEHVDVFVKPGTPEDYNGPVFVIDQKKPGNGHWDEHKAMIGFADEAAARAGYLENYEKNWDGIRAITQMSMDQFKTWLKEGDTTRPASEAGGGKRAAAFSRNSGQIDTPAFKKWFGDSKVVDANGEPLVVYHGTNASFDVFQPHSLQAVHRLNGKEIKEANSWDMGEDRTGMPEGYHYGALSDVATLGAKEALKYRTEEARRGGNFGKPDTERTLRDLRRLQEGELTWAAESRPNGNGMWFTPDREYSFISRRNTGSDPDANIMPVYLSIKNPVYLSSSEIEGAGLSFNVAKYKKAGYDGAVFAEDLKNLAKSGWNGATQIVAFNPEQVKSAIGNAGTFDVSNPDIRMSRGRGVGMTAEDINATIVPIKNAAKNLPPVVVLESAKQAPEELRQDIKKNGAEGDVAGAFHGGQIYLFADQIRDPDHAQFVLLHEATHFGLRALFGPEIDPVLMRMWITNPTVRGAASELIAKYGLSKVRAVEEVLADMGGKNVQPTVWQRLVGFLRDWLRRNGFTARFVKGLSDADIVRVLQQASAYWKEGKGKTATHLYRDGAFSRNEELSSRMAEGETRTTKGSLGADKGRLIDLLGKTMYKSDIANVTVKELFQNSFDAIKAAQHKGLITGGKIDITTDNKAHTIKVVDNGIGMTADTVQKAFFTIAGTEKSDLPPAMRSGGLGLAKMAFMFGSERITLSTVRDGVRTDVSTTAENIKNDAFDIKESPTKDASGTTVSVQLPESVIGEDDNQKRIWIPESSTYLDALTSFFTGKDVAVTLNGKPVEMGPPGEKKQTMNFSWGDVDLYIRPTEGNWPKQQVLSAGIYQFDTRIRKPGEAYSVAPFDAVADVHAKVSPQHPNYPFNNQRENFRETVKADVGKITDYFEQFVADEYAKELAGQFSNFQQFERVDPRAPATVNNAMSAVQLGDVKGGGGSMSERFSADTSKIDTTRPLYHNNTNVDWISDVDKELALLGAAPDAEQFFSELGSAVTEFVYEASGVKGYGDLAHYLSGLSFDKGYGGVHITVPFKGLFINPVYKEFFANYSTVEGLAGGFLHLLKHEATHVGARSHDATFAFELAKIDAALHESGANRRMLRSLRSVFRRHLPTFQIARGIYDDAATANVGKSLDGGRIAAGEDGAGGRDAENGTGGVKGEGRNAVSSSRVASTPEGTAGQGRGPNAESTAGTSLDLKPYTAAELKAREEATAKAEAEKAKQPPVKKVTADQADLFQTQGSLFSRNSMTAMAKNGIRRALAPETGQSGLKARYKAVAQRVINFTDRLANPLVDLPGQSDYLKNRQVAMGVIGSGNEVVKEIRNIFADASPEDRRAAYDFFTTEGASPAGIQSEAIRNGVQTIKDAINHVSDQLVDKGIISADARDEFRDRYLPQLYLRHLLEDNAWKSMGAGKKTSDMGYAKARKLEQFRNAEGEIRLRDKETGKALSDEEALKLGPVTDPEFLASVALARPMRDMAILDWLDSISKDERWVLPNTVMQWNGKRVSPYFLKTEADRLRRQAGYYEPEAAKRANAYADRMDAAANQALEKLPAESDGFTQIPNTGRYGAMRGIWVRTEIYHDLVGNTHFQPADMNWFQNLFGMGGIGAKATSMWKGTKTYLNPSGQVRNFVTNMTQLQLSGVPFHSLPPLLVRTIGQMKDKGKYFQEFKTQGGEAGTFANEDLGRMQRELLDMEHRDGSLSTWGKLHRAAAIVTNKAGDIWQANEVLGKLMKFIHERERGASAADAMVAANKTLFDYSLVPPWIRYARSVPFGIPFATWNAKILPNLVETALLHPVRYLPYVALYYGAQYALAHLLGVGYDDLEKLRRAMPQWLWDKKNAVLMPWKDAKGRWEVMDMSYFMPWTQWTQLGNDIISGKVSNALQDIGAFGGPIPNIISAISTQQDPFTHRDIANKGDPPMEQVWSWLNYAWSLAAPPFLTDTGATGHALRAYTGTTNKFGDPLDTGTQAALRFMGVNLYALTPEQTRAANLQHLEAEARLSLARLKQRSEDRSLSPAKHEELEKEYRNEIIRRGIKMSDYAKESEIHPRLSTHH